MPLVSSAIELNFLRIRTRWTTDADSENADLFTEEGSPLSQSFASETESMCVPLLLPHVEQDQSKRVETLSENQSRDLFERFLELKTQDEALYFLQQVGVWDAVQEDGLYSMNAGVYDLGCSHEKIPVKFPSRLLSRDGTEVGLPGMRMTGTFGSRWFAGRARWITPMEIWGEQARWKTILTAQKNKTARIPSNLGTLPARMDWTNKYSRVVIEPMTAKELMIAMGWLISRGQLKYCRCQYLACGKPFLSQEELLYCPDKNCRAYQAKRNYRQGLVASGKTTRGTKRKRGRKAPSALDRPHAGPDRIE